MNEIEVWADFWSNGNPTGVSTKVLISKTDEGIMVNGQSATMEYNGIQLRLTVKGTGLYILFNNRMRSKITIKEIHDQLA